MCLTDALSPARGDFLGCLWVPWPAVLNCKLTGDNAEASLVRRCWRTNHGAQATRVHLHPESSKAAHRVMPRLVAMMRTGAMSLSRARLRKEKLSISSMWTSSMNSTWKPVGHRSRSGWRLRTQARPAYLSPVTHPRDDLRLALLSPLSHLGIDLFSDF